VLRQHHSDASRPATPRPGACRVTRRGRRCANLASHARLVAVSGRDDNFWPRSCVTRTTATHLVARSSRLTGYARTPTMGDARGANPGVFRRPRRSSTTSDACCAKAASREVGTRNVGRMCSGSTTETQTAMRCPAALPFPSLLCPGSTFGPKRTRHVWNCSQVVRWQHNRPRNLSTPRPQALPERSTAIFDHIGHRHNPLWYPC
jgi:hypothetical protein